MSETQTAPVPEAQPAPSQPSESLHHQEDEDSTKPLTYERHADEGEANGEAKPEEPDKPPEKSADDLRKEERRREAQRIGQLNRQRYAQQARADAAEKRAQELEAQLRQYTGAAQGQQQPTAEDIDRLAAQRAAQIAAEQERVKRVNDWDAAGKQQHGEEAFAKACQTVADMADDAQRRTLLAVAMDVDGAQAAVMKMADDAELAEKILAMPPHKMALEIAKLAAPAAEPAKPKPATRLPPPIRPPTIGQPKGAPNPHGSWDEFKRWSAQQDWKR